jgi:hypothetical protein
MSELVDIRRECQTECLTDQERNFASQRKNSSTLTSRDECDYKGPRERASRYK